MDREQGGYLYAQDLVGSVSPLARILVDSVIDTKIGSGNGATVRFAGWSEMKGDGPNTSCYPAICHAISSQPVRQFKGVNRNLVISPPRTWTASIYTEMGVDNEKRGFGANRDQEIAVRCMTVTLGLHPLSHRSGGVESRWIAFHLDN